MKIVIIDTKCSNLLSITTAIKKIGFYPTISNDVNVISQADKLFLPGVGSAQSAMKQLNKEKIVNIIKKHNKPILGICLGMQLLSKKSEENKKTNTLGIIDIETKRIQNNKLPLPHMGWNKIKILKKHNLFNNIHDANAYFYFAHSYAIPICDVTIASTYYNHLFTSVLMYKNFFGVQFHPEKSGKIGKQLLKNFLEI